MSKVVSISLPEDLLDKLLKLFPNKKRSHIIREAIEAYTKKEEMKEIEESIKNMFMNMSEKEKEERKLWSEFGIGDGID